MNVVQDWRRYKGDRLIVSVEVIDDGKRVDELQYWRLRVKWRDRVMFETEECMVKVLQYFTYWVSFLNEMIEIGREHGGVMK